MNSSNSRVPVSVLVPIRNEAENLPRCLSSVQWADEIFVVDSRSTDGSIEIAQRHGAKVVQFEFNGVWPKKKNWALENLPFKTEWVLILDADEVLPAGAGEEIANAIANAGAIAGYWICRRFFFLGRWLRHAYYPNWNLRLFRHSLGRYEKLTSAETKSGDNEVHEHVVVQSESKTRVTKLHHALLHHNVESLSHYILKHDKYSNWDARLWFEGEANARDLAPSLFGSQAQRRRWLRKMFFSVSGSPVLFFLYKYILCLGFLDGIPGLIYCGLQGVQFFHIKAKIYELKTLGMRREQS